MTLTQQENDLKVIGIGASAGGLDAIQSFVNKLSQNTGYAFIIIQHLSPNHKSLMPEILAKHTKMKIYTAEDDLLIEPNCIYLNESKNNLTIKNNRLSLIDKPSKEKLNLPIDIFFHSLGENYEGNAIGIILSGTGSDGSRGIKTIKEKGGLVFVQSSTNAQFDGMPNAAIATGYADFILPAEDIGNYFVKYTADRFKTLLDKSNISEELYQKILKEVESYSGIKFSRYKRNTLLRRLEKRVNINSLDSIEDYYHLLLTDKKEIISLSDDFLIGVTRFFRDNESFKTLKNKLFHRLCLNRSEPIRIWVPGCSTGEEAYSIAISLYDYIEENNLNLEFKLFATDIVEDALIKAGKGRYHANACDDIGSQYLEKYFIQSGDQIEIVKKIRNKVVFSKNNLLTDPPFIRIDFISCKNLLIYLENDAQNHVLQNFLFSLNTGGFLQLGRSESLREHEIDFTTLDSKWKLFETKHKSIRKSEFRSDITPFKTINYLNKKAPSQTPESSFYKYISDTYGPSMLFLDQDFNIQFLKGDVGKKLQPKEGIFLQNLIQMVDPSLAAVIRNGLRRTERENTPVTIKNVYLNESETKVFDLTFTKTKLDKDHSPLFVVEFSEDRESTQPIEVKNFQLDDLARQRIEDLEYELKVKNNELKNLIEELETNNEELQSSNEELMASNEELQSTNEELQSVNEELYTVNNELQNTNNELKDINSIVNGLYEAQEIATLFLDKQLRIKHFTPSFKHYLDLNENDFGRILSSFMFLDQTTRELVIDGCEQCIVNGKAIEHQILISEKYSLLKIQPLISDLEINGIVITIIDIHESIKTSTELEVIEKHYQSLFMNMHEAILHGEIVTNNTGEAIDWRCLNINPAFENYTGLKGENIIGKLASEVLSKDKSNPAEWYSQIGHTALDGEDYSFQEYSPSLDRYFNVNVFSPKKGEFALTFIDTTTSVKSEKEVKQSKERYQALFENLNTSFSHGKIIFNGKNKPVDWEFLTVNKAHSNLTGLPINIAGKRASDFLDKSRLTYWLNLYAEVATSGKPKSYKEYIATFKKYLHIDIFSPAKNEFAAIFTDITKEVEIENERALFATRLNLALELEKIALWEWDIPTDSVAPFNSFWKDIYGFSNEALSKQLEERLFEEDRINAEKKLKAHIARETESFYQVYRIWNKDRTSYKWIKNTGQIIDADKHGNPLKILSVSADISEEKTSEIELQRVTDELQKAQSLSKIGSWYLDLTNSELTWTKEVHRMFGIATSRPPISYLKQKKYYTEESWKILSESIDMASSHGTPYDLELEMAADLPIQWMRAIGESIKNEDGKIIGIRGTIQDISEKKEVYEKLAHEKMFAEALTENGAAGFYIFDVIENKNTYSNKKTGEILGYSPAELQNMSSDEFMGHFHQEDFANVVNHISRLVDNKISEIITYRFRHKNGEYRTCYSVDSPFEFDEKGNLKTYLGSFIDITELQEKEEELLEAKNEAETASKQKDLFLSNLSHEIRTPMNGILGFSQLLQGDDISDNDRSNYLNQIDKESKQLMRIINDLLDFSRISSGKLSLIPKDINVNDLIETLIATHKSNLSIDNNDKIQISSFIPKTPVLANLDPERISQVINNLITNAIKFTPEGEIEVGYSTYQKDKLLFWVKDNGVGIKPEKQKLIFERFSQAEEQLSLQMGGLGLGLSICKSIINSLGGEFSLKSEYGKGSYFSFHIPLVKGKNIEESKKKNTLPDKPKCNKLLIVDDNSSIHYYYKSILKKSNISILQAFDGQEAVDIFKKEKNIDLVLMDIRMPNMDGVEALKEIRKINSETPVVAQSAFALPEQIRQFKSEGFDGYYSKPIEPEDVMKLLNLDFDK